MQFVGLHEVFLTLFGSNMSMLCDFVTPTVISVTLMVVFCNTSKGVCEVHMDLYYSRCNKTLCKVLSNSTSGSFISLLGEYNS